MKIIMKTIITDGGKPANLQEHNLDCTVRALACATGLSYEVAYIIAEDAGRQPGCSYPWAQVVREWVFQGFGHYEWDTDTRDTTVAAFIRQHPQGRFVIRTQFHGAKIGHVFAVVDGVVYDNYKTSLRRKVRSFYQLFPKENKANA